MKLSNKQEAEVLKAYHTYWDSYFKGDMETFALVLDENCHIIGSTEFDVFDNKKSAVDFYSATAEQIADKADFWNRKIKVLPYADSVMVHETCDFYLLADGEWHFYGHVRLSTLLSKRKNDWKIIHQHGSLPDAKTEEGEQTGIEKVKEENRLLREAVKRRTVELEHRNRELEIESSLERVRTVAMAMNEPADMLTVCKTIAGQLQLLGVNDIRNVQTAIFYEAKGTYINYEYYARHDKTIITETSYTTEKTLKAFARKMLKGKDEVYTTNLAGKDLADWLAYQQTTNVFVDPFLAQTASLHYYWYSLGPIAMGLSSYAPLPDEALTLFKRFRNVFDLAYRRYLDIEKAQMQAREAMIEAALERTRAQSMLMQHSNELDDTLRVFHKQVLLLGIHSAFSFLWLPDELNERHVFWAAWAENNAAVFKSKAINYPLDRNEPATAQCLIDWKDKEPVVSYHVPPVGVESYFMAWSELIAGVEELKPENFVEGLYYVEAFIQYGCFGIMVKKELAEEEKKILYRFAVEFERAYTRFIDLQKAEAQAREVQVELSLEKVRSRSMAMHQSNELAEAASVLFQQIKELGYEMWSCGFCIWKPDDFSELWMSADAGGLLPPMLMPYRKDPTHRKIYEASLRQEPVHEYIWEGEELAEHYKFLYTIPSAKEAIDILRKSGLSLPARQCYYVGFFKQGYLLMITKEPVAQMHDLTYRFTRVFEQTYTRFLDLQKAEQLTEQTKLDLIQIQTEKQRAETALIELKATQAQLIHAEKMASLGELMAGIAHEIQNPLNFVNNFSEVSTELVAELEEEQQKPARNPDLETDMLADVRQNLQKITHHGQRASAIVRAMLEHSRISTGQSEPTNLNKLADEYLPLAYQGIRAKDKLFSCEISTDFDTNVGMVNLVPQDIGRVLLNLYNNAFYAVAQRWQTASADYQPRIQVSTQRTGSGIEIRVSDNGTGMAASVKAKIFQPFFTTKPSGQGTGLGLSLSYDIVKAHGGTLRVESTVGDSSVFTITLP